MMSLWLRSRRTHWLAWPLSVYFLLALVLTGLHCHVNAGPSHACTACSMSQAPATTPTPVPVGEITSPRGATIVYGLNQPDHGILAVPASRGPPLA
jgi:hypothetical protein